MICWRFRTYFYDFKFKCMENLNRYNRGNLPIEYFRLGVVEYLDLNPYCVGVGIKSQNGVLIVCDYDREITSRVVKYSQ